MIDRYRIEELTDRVRVSMADPEIRKRVIVSAVGVVVLLLVVVVYSKNFIPKKPDKVTRERALSNQSTSAALQENAAATDAQNRYPKGQEPEPGSGKAGSSPAGG